MLSGEVDTGTPRGGMGAGSTGSGRSYPKTDSKDNYCLRDLVHTLCGGPMKCNFGEEKCKFVHVKKENIDMERLKSNVEVFGSHIKGFEPALRAKLLEEAAK